MAEPVVAEKATEAKLPPVEHLEDDDEFEEFDVEDWGEREEAPANAKQWEDDWDDDSVSDDFSKQLRAELEKQPQQPPKEG